MWPAVGSRRNGQLHLEHSSQRHHSDTTSRRAYIPQASRPLLRIPSGSHSTEAVLRQSGLRGWTYALTRCVTIRAPRCLSELNVEILCANSSQAKGRVERANRTLQDLLVKELRLAGISDMEAGNAYLQGFTDRHNSKFAKAPAKPDNLHRALNVEPDRLADVLCWRENRYVGKQLTFSYDRKRVMLEENDITRGLVGKYVDTYAFVDGRFEVRSKGRSLPYTIFDMDQRVTHAAITDNKRLSAVLEHIKEMQDAASPKPKVRTNSEKMGYKPNGRRQGRPSGSRAKKNIAHTAE